jgi:4-amino-4-deoxy-L-arabinose transferase-like glycosyltransferase
MGVGETRFIAASLTGTTGHLATRRLIVSAAPWTFILALFFAGLGDRDLTSSHEARAAQNAQRMLDTGEWARLALFDGRADLQKPPGYYWMVAALGKLNGGTVTEWVARLPAALAGLVCVLLVYSFLRADGRPTAATVAALVLATATHFTAIARTARIDVPLTLAVGVSLVAFYRGCTSGRTPHASAGVIASAHPRTRVRGSPGLVWHLLSALAAGVAVLLKGPVALALIGPAAVAWLVIECRYSQVRLPIASLLLGLLVVAAVALPWFLWMNAATGGEFFRVFFWHHTVARFTGSSPLLASHPTWYYLPRFAIDFLPWTPALVALVVWAVRSGHWRRDPAMRFGVVAGVVMIVVLSTAKFKRADYLLPAYPFAAIALGCAAEAWLACRTNPRTVRGVQWGFAGVLGAVAVGWAAMVMVVEPRQEAREEQRHFAEAIRRHAPAPQVILQFRMESHLLSYHLGPPLHTLVEWGELNERLAAPGPHFVVMPPEYIFAAGEVVKSRKLVEVTRLEHHTRGTPPKPLVFLRTAD